MTIDMTTDMIPWCLSTSFNIFCVVCPYITYYVGVNIIAYVCLLYWSLHSVYCYYMYKYVYILHHVVCFIMVEYSLQMYDTDSDFAKNQLTKLSLFELTSFMLNIREILIKHKRNTEISELIFFTTYLMSRCIHLPLVIMNTHDDIVMDVLFYIILFFGFVFTCMWGNDLSNKYKQI